MQVQTSVKTERNYGIDLLRLISMLYVLVLHALGRGGLLDHTQRLSVQYQFGWFMQLWALCAVDIFALISGYVGYTEKIKKYNYANYVVMWLQVVTYGVGLSLLFYLKNPEWLTRQQLQQMFFPVSNQLFWYFNAYTGLFFVIPLLNRAVRQSGSEELRRIIVGGILLFSVFEAVTGGFKFDRGYTFTWLAILYFLGAAIKKCEIGKQMPKATAFIGIVACSVLSWLWRMYGETFVLFGKIIITREQLCTYVAPTNLCAAIFHVILFSKLKFGRVLKKIISFAAPGALAVYLINTQEHIWNYFMADRFAYLASESVGTIFTHVMVFVLSFLTVSVLVDYVRRKVFDLFRVKQVAEYLTEWAGRILCCCANKLMR